MCPPKPKINIQQPEEKKLKILRNELLDTEKPAGSTGVQSLRIPLATNNNLTGFSIPTSG